ncbi:MAG: hypothetical protein U0625_06995 [Phycisphaerales bacterium]
MPKLDTLSQRFLSELERVMPRDGFRAEFTDRLVVTIPAKHAEVGDITVWLDGDEVTVGIGQLHHCHFEVCIQTDPTLDEREQAAAESAARYIRDILDERVHFQVEFEAGRCRGSGSWYPEHSERFRPLSGVDEVREYVWSHRVR